MVEAPGERNNFLTWVFKRSIERYRKTPNLEVTKVYKESLQNEMIMNAKGYGGKVSRLGLKFFGGVGQGVKKAVKHFYR